MDEADRAGGNSSVVTWRPVWTDKPYEAWARTYVRKNMWRVDKLFDREDALQECAVIFLRCCRVYEGKISNSKHFMALFMRSVENDFNRFAHRNRCIGEAAVVAAELHYRRPGVELPDGPLLALLSRASEELRAVLVVILTCPSELRRLMLDWPRDGLRARPSRDEAAFSRSLCRLARTNLRSDLVAELRTLLR